MGGRWERGSRRRRHLYLQLIHIAIWQKPTGYCNTILPQLKINKLKTKFWDNWGNLNTNWIFDDIKEFLDVIMVLKLFFFFLRLCFKKESFLIFLSFFFSFIFISWRLITLQYYFAIHWHESAMDLHVFTILNAPSHLPPHPIPLGLPNAPAPSTYASNLDWRSVSHLIIYLFQCSCLRSSHPHIRP